MRKPQSTNVSALSNRVIISGGNTTARAELSEVLRQAGYEVIASGDTESIQPLHAELESNLSPREQEVLEFASQGLPDKAIAGELGISMRTVRYHLDRAMRKLGAHNRTEAVTRSGLGNRFL